MDDTGSTGKPKGLEVPEHLLESVKRSISAMAKPMGRLETKEFPPLTYVEPTLGGDPPPASGHAPTPRPPPTPARQATAQPSESLRQRILAFQDQLDATEEVGLRPISGGATIRPSSVMGDGNGLIAIEGRLDDDDSPCELVLHASQMNLLLVRCDAPDTRQALRVR